jgi:endonuclease-3
MAKKTTRKNPRKPRRKAAVKGPKKRARADAKAVQGELPPWSKAEIAEAFRRFRAASPEPRGELEHINPFTLLVAVVLSARPLCSRLPTRRKRWRPSARIACAI